MLWSVGRPSTGFQKLARVLSAATPVGTPVKALGVLLDPDMHVRFGDRVVWIERDPAARAAETAAVLGAEPDGLVDLCLQAEDRLLGRADIEVTVVTVTDLNAHPWRTFRRLKRAGWPVKPRLAARLWRS